MKLLKTFKIFMILVILMTLTGCVKSEEPFLGLRIDVISTGKSDCIIVQLNDSAILIDLAEDDDASKVKNYITSLGIDKFELAVISHFDKDHIGTAATILSRFEIDTLVQPNYQEESVDYTNYINAINNNNVNAITLTQNMTTTIDEMTVNITVASNDLMASDSNTNNKSLIVDIIYKEKHFTFLGDAMKKRVDEYLTYANYESLYMKFPYHGGYNNATEALLNQANPKYVAITCSRNQPADTETIALLESKAINYYTTIQGHIVFKYDGTIESFVVK